MEKDISELKKIDNKLSKIILFILSIILDFWLAVIAISFFKSIKFSESGFDQNIVHACIYSTIFILFTIFLFRKLINKKGRSSYNVMKRFCSYEELEQLTRKEEFKQIIFDGIDKVYESRFWLIIGDTFVPKNFITSAYLSKGAKGIYYINFILIDGSFICYTATAKGNNLEKIKRTIRKYVKQIVIFDNRSSLSEKVTKELKLRYEKYKNSNDYVEFIQKWNNEFDIKSLVKY